MADRPEICIRILDRRGELALDGPCREMTAPSSKINHYSCMAKNSSKID